MKEKLPLYPKVLKKGQGKNDEAKLTEGFLPKPSQGTI